MDVLSLIHQDSASPGVFGDELTALGCRHEIASFALDRPPARDPRSYDAVMVFGGSMHVDQGDRHPWLESEKALLRELVAARRPVVGVCLGAQLLVEAAGGHVGELARGPEIGWHELELCAAAADDPLLGGLPTPLRALEWHSYGAAKTPPGATQLARNDAGVQAFRVEGAPAWGIQFHAEADAATLERWVAQEDDRGPRVDTAALRERNPVELPRWNEIGRGICRGFAEVAAAAAPA